jgi:Family of unknown function (DUF6416)
MIDVTVKVPEDRVGEFYEMVGRWLTGEELAVGALGSPVTGLKDWTDSPEDLTLARVVWEKLSPRAKAIFSLLMDNPGEKVSAEDLASACDIPHGIYGVAGAMSWPGRHCAAVNRHLPVKWQEGSDDSGGLYWFEPETADLFSKARG